MDFFASQDTARRKTGLLVAYFVAAVVLIVLSVYAAVLAILFGGAAKAGADEPLRTFLNPTVFLCTTGITLAIVVSGTLYKMAALRGGGAAVARMLGGRPVDSDSRVPSERKLLNVVEEMAIASGVPVPPVYRIPEKSINAFAAGYTASDCVIGVTEGCMERLSRDELQGVMGHEFSHILNGDMRLNIRLMGVLNGILVIALIGYGLMRTASYTRSSSSKKGGNPLPLLGLALLVIGYIGVFFGKLIKSAVSRQREFLADASAVQFTRNPDGLVGALAKIGGLRAGSRIQNSKAEELSHMFFANGVKSALGGALATHPPLQERIRRLDPAFEGFSAAATTAVADDSPVSQLAGAGGVAAPPLPVAAAVPAHAAVAQIGAPAPAHVDYATALLAAIPDAVREKTREPFGARAVVLALLLDTDAATQQTQLNVIASDGALFGEVLALLPLVQSLPRQSRLPIVELSLPALRRLSPEQYRIFRERVAQLVEADEEISLFEYALQRLLLRHLAPTFAGSPAARRQTLTLRDALPSCRDLLSTLAYYGHDDADRATHAFDQAYVALGSGTHAAIKPLAECSLGTVDTALNKLAAGLPVVKKRVLEACATCVASDGAIAPEEADMLRAVADSLDCPMPPLLAA